MPKLVLRAGGRQGNGPAARLDLRKQRSHRRESFYSGQVSLPIAFALEPSAEGQKLPIREACR